MIIGLLFRIYLFEACPTTLGICWINMKYYFLCLTNYIGINAGGYWLLLPKQSPKYSVRFSVWQSMCIIIMAKNYLFSNKLLSKGTSLFISAVGYCCANRNKVLIRSGRQHHSQTLYLSSTKESNNYNTKLEMRQLEKLSWNILVSQSGERFWSEVQTIYCMGVLMLFQGPRLGKVVSFT